MSAIKTVEKFINAAENEPRHKVIQSFYAADASSRKIKMSPSGIGLTNLVA